MCERKCEQKELKEGVRKFRQWRGVYIIDLTPSISQESERERKIEREGKQGRSVMRGGEENLM